MGGATNVLPVAGLVMGFQSTLPVGGATGRLPPPPPPEEISIHAPRGGSDLAVTGWKVSPGNFNPRSPWGERQEKPEHQKGHLYFNPRSPWGERRAYRYKHHNASRFQSTLPVGGATIARDLCVVCLGISIHAPRGGSDYVGFALGGVITIFQSTLPVGGATVAF